MPKGIKRSFALDDMSAKAPSRMDCDLVIDGCRYHYGFIFGEHRVMEEWLYSFPTMSRHRVLFHRYDEDGTKFYFGPHLKGNHNNIKNQTRDDALFLSTAGVNNHMQLKRLWDYFQDCIEFNLDADNEFLLSLEANDLETNDQMRDFVVSFLREADTGVSGVKIKKISDDHLKEILNINMRLFDDLDNRKKAAKIAKNLINIYFEHKIDSDSFYLPYEWESRGTQTMLGMAIQVYRALDQGGILVVDELESGLHPFAAMRLVELFQEESTNPKGAQLLFATHLTHLMGELAPAQIWLCEKNRQGATEIYPMTAVQPRKEENLENGYLRGRYGGVPYMGSINNLCRWKNEA
ncbi:MAG: ATP-binding protein [Magnetococcales bacterium]|nr:ATP-binding protein [Magnetococcales bacterium]